MDALKVQLQALLARARTWEERIKKTTYADNVAFTPDTETGEFTITVQWTTRTGEKGSFSKAFTKDFIFGPVARRGSFPRINRQVCSYMREFMQMVLHSRGV
jgi:hypothetical protein